MILSGYAEGTWPLPMTPPKTEGGNSARVLPPVPLHFLLEPPVGRVSWDEAVTGDWETRLAGYTCDGRGKGEEWMRIDGSRYWRWPRRTCSLLYIQSTWASFKRG